MNVILFAGGALLDLRLEYKLPLFFLIFITDPLILHIILHWDFSA
jgi:hypothetical protein